MNKSSALKRLYKDYTSKFIGKILLAAMFSILVAGSTSATAWLLDPAIEKIFLNKDQTLIVLIPLAIIVAFSTKGISLYLARLLMINVSEEVKKMLQTDMLKSFIKADTVILCPIYKANENIKLNFSYNSFAKLIIKNSKVKLIRVNNEVELKNLLKQTAYGEKLYIGMGAGSISSWMKNLKNNI